jgi:hypothetical protein
MEWKNRTPLVTGASAGLRSRDVARPAEHSHYHPSGRHDQPEADEAVNEDGGEGVGPAQVARSAPRRRNRWNVKAVPTPGPGDG